MGGNPNHPVKGSSIVVDPIRDVEAIRKIKGRLQDRDLLLFTLGINNGLRVSDLLRLKVSDVKGLGIGGKVIIREKKTRKRNVLVINEEVFPILDRYLKSGVVVDEDFLFKSPGVDKAICVPYANNLVKKWCRDVGLVGNFGSHTLRKTFGFIQRTVFGVSWEMLSYRFGHSSPAITMRYLGISEDEVCSMLMNPI